MGIAETKLKEHGSHRDNVPVASFAGIVASKVAGDLLAGQDQRALVQFRMQRPEAHASELQHGAGLGGVGRGRTIAHIEAIGCEE